MPNVPLSKVPEGYAQLVGHGFDSWQESAAVSLSQSLVERLEDAQAEARSVHAATGDDLGVPLQLGQEVLHVRPFGAKGGVRWVLSGPDFMLLIRSPKLEYSVTMRYLAAGLWQYGVEALRARVLAALEAVKHGFEPGSVRVSRADFAFDFYSPAFTGEFTPGLAGNVVVHSSTKVREKLLAGSYSRGGMGETLSIGSKAGLEVEVYDKTKEIREASGKDWMQTIWAECLEGEVVENDVWRLEVRMGKEFLRERQVWLPQHVEDCLPELLAEALFMRRLTVPRRGDSNRARWPLHPLWTLAYLARGAGHMRPLGKQITMRRSQLERLIGKQLSGTLIAAGVLTHGSAEKLQIERIAEHAVSYALADSQRETKIERAKERYRFVTEAR